MAYRDANGPFRSRHSLLEVPRLGKKTFELAAGFLRIGQAENPLDSSAVHPERYPIVEKMASDMHCSVRELVQKNDLRSKIQLDRYVGEDVGLPTLQDIMEELTKPGRDPRRNFEMFQFADGVEKTSDLKPGMRIPGIVTNVAAFGAFVDIGVHQDGLVHVSQLADKFVKDPMDVVKTGQKVMVTVMEVDLERKRISLSMKSRPDLTPKSGTKNGPKEASRPKTAPARPSAPAPSFGGDWFDQAMRKHGGGQ